MLLVDGEYRYDTLENFIKKEPQEDEVNQQAIIFDIEENDEKVVVDERPAYLNRHGKKINRKNLNLILDRKDQGPFLEDGTEVEKTEKTLQHQSSIPAINEPYIVNKKFIKISRA